MCVIARQVPHSYNIMNHVRVATYLSLLYTSIMLVFVIFTPGVADGALAEYKASVTTAMWAGQIPMFLLGGVLSHFRLRFFNITVVNRFL